MILATSGGSTELAVAELADGGLRLTLTPVAVSTSSMYATAETVTIELTDELHKQLARRYLSGALRVARAS